MRFVAALALLPVVAFGVTVETLPPSGYADTEVSTNIAFAVERPAMSRIEFTVALDATPTNNVEVAIGKDENGDGNLSVEEAACTFGYDCGKWFKRSKSEAVVEQWNLSTCASLASGETPLPRLGEQTEQEANHHCTTSTTDYDLSSHTFILKRQKLDTGWNLLKVTRRGCGASCELVKVEGRRPGFMLEVW